MDRSTFHPEQLLQALTAVASGAEIAANRHIRQTFGHELLRRDAVLVLPVDVQAADAPSARRRDDRPASGTAIVPDTGETIPRVEQ